MKSTSSQNASTIATANAAPSTMFRSDPMPRVFGTGRHILEVESPGGHGCSTPPHLRWTARGQTIHRGVESLPKRSARHGINSSLRPERCELERLSWLAMTIPLPPEDQEPAPEQQETWAGTTRPPVQTRAQVTEALLKVIGPEALADRGGE
jgi:hypothetical protein